MEVLRTFQLQYPCEIYLLNSDDCRGGLKGNECDASHRPMTSFHHILRGEKATVIRLQDWVTRFSSWKCSVNDNHMQEALG